MMRRTEEEQTKDLKSVLRPEVVKEDWTNEILFHVLEEEEEREADQIQQWMPD